MTTTEHHFQVNLGGIIELLSEHLYGESDVFLRELIQNAVDAIEARANTEADDYQGEIHIHIHRAGDKGTENAGLLFSIEDNGIGLSEQEVHQFLATIGSSSKRHRTDLNFIGQFGIGLLSAFIVADELELVSCSKHQIDTAIRWQANSKGSYQLQPYTQAKAIGSRLSFQVKAEHLQLFEPDALIASLKHYAVFLEYPIYVHDSYHEDGGILINEEAPWKQVFHSESDRHDAWMKYGETILGYTPFDVLDISREDANLQGLAFILPWAASNHHQHKHRIYLKNMFVSENAKDLLPDWAFFVQCIINSRDVRPTASRESFVRDAKLELCRAHIENKLKDYIVSLAKYQGNKMRDFISLHNLVIKALAIQDDDFFDLIIPWLDFESSLGRLTLPDYVQQFSEMRYCSNLNLFRQLAPIANAQGLCVINTAYVYSHELLEKYVRQHQLNSIQMDVNRLSSHFHPLSLEEREICQSFLLSADKSLEAFGCRINLQYYAPHEIASLYMLSDSQEYLRNIERTQEHIDNELWSDLLEEMKPTEEPIKAELFLNMNNSLIRRLVLLRSEHTIWHVVHVLYAQALLLGHYSLNVAEMQLLNQGVLFLVDEHLKNIQPLSGGSHASN